MRLAPRARVKRERNGKNVREADAIEDVKRIRAPIIAGCVQGADLACEVSFETTNAGEQTGERERKGDVERHPEMTGEYQ